MAYNLFIGRFQSPHKGHQTIFNTYLEKGLPVLIAIRNTPINENNPLEATLIAQLWRKIYEGNPLVEVIIIPDICSVNYGRGVGYEVNQIQVSEQIANISATDIRNQIQHGESAWKAHVDEKIWEDLEIIFRD